MVATVGEGKPQSAESQQGAPTGAQSVTSGETEHAVTESATPGGEHHAQQTMQFPSEAKEIKRWKRVVIWILGVVVASLIPFAWASQSSKPNVGGPSVYQLLGSGDLYLVSVIVLIAGLTEIVLLMRQLDEFTVALLVLAAIFFVIIDAARYAGASAIANTSSPLPRLTQCEGPFVQR